MIEFWELGWWGPQKFSKIRDLKVNYFHPPIHLANEKRNFGTISMQKINEQKNKEPLLGAQKTLIPKGSACSCHRCPKSCSFKLYIACTYGQKLYIFYFNLLFQFLFQVNTVGTNFLQSSPVLGSDFVFQIFSQSSQIFSHERNWHKNDNS